MAIPINIPKNSINPTAALEEKDPLETIETEMHARGFIGLWAAIDPKNNRNGLTDESRRIFLRHYSVSGRIAWSAVMAGVSRFAIRRLRRQDAAFDAACGEAAAYFKDLLIQEMTRRGVYGYEEGAIGGKNRDQVIMLTKYSDRLLEQLVHVHTRTGKHAVQDKQEAAPAQVTNNQFNFSNLSPEDLAMTKRLLENQSNGEGDDS